MPTVSPIARGSTRLAVDREPYLWAVRGNEEPTLGLDREKEGVGVVSASGAPVSGLCGESAASVVFTSTPLSGSFTGKLRSSFAVAWSRDAGETHCLFRLRQAQRTGGHQVLEVVWFSGINDRCGRCPTVLMTVLTGGRLQHRELAVRARAAIRPGWRCEPGTMMGTVAVRRF